MQSTEAAKTKYNLERLVMQNLVSLADTGEGLLLGDSEPGLGVLLWVGLVNPSV